MTEDELDVYMMDLDQILQLSQRIAAAVRPDRIILFGSYAYGVPREDSDVDLLVIAPFRGNGLNRATQILRAVNAPSGIDLLVRGPADVARRYRQFDPLIREALDHGKVLYERDSKGMGREGRRRLRQRGPRAARTQVPQS